MESALNKHALERISMLIIEFFKVSLNTLVLWNISINDSEKNAFVDGSLPDSTSVCRYLFPKN